MAADGTDGAKDFAAEINAASTTGWLRAMGIVVTRATTDEVRCELTVAEQHLQGYGIVHGGVHCGVIETIASVGAHLVAMSRGQRAVGLENHTSFIRAVRVGAKLEGIARPVTRGRSSQVWEAEIREGAQLVARGSVRLLCIAAEQLTDGK